MPKDGESAATLNLTEKIRVVRGQRVVLDSDLAGLYGVATKVFNQAVRRNADRFTEDFWCAFQIKSLQS